METINKLRAECVRYYVEKDYPLDHCEMYVPKDEAEIRRIYGCIQEEQKNPKRFKEVPRPLEGLNIVEIVEIDPTEETTAD